MNTYLKSLVMIVAVSDLLALSLGGYMAAYLWLGSIAMLTDRVTVVRVYESNTLATVFRPAARAESLLTGSNVFTGC